MVGVISGCVCDTTSKILLVVCPCLARRRGSKMISKGRAEGGLGGRVLGSWAEGEAADGARQGRTRSGQAGSNCGYGPFF